MWEWEGLPKIATLDLLVFVDCGLRPRLVYDSLCTQLFFLHLILYHAISDSESASDFSKLDLWGAQTHKSPKKKSNSPRSDLFPAPKQGQFPSVPTCWLQLWGVHLKVYQCSTWQALDISNFTTCHDWGVNHLLRASQQIPRPESPNLASRMAEKACVSI